MSKECNRHIDRMHGLDWYDYGARWMDASIGRWHSIDPLCEKYYNVSPYVYCVNNPMKYVDPDGRASTDFYDENGNVKHIDDGSNAVFQIVDSGTSKHYEFKGFDKEQGGKDIVNMESAIQEQQIINNSNPSLQEHNGTTYCNFATQCIMKTVASFTGDKNAVITGRANIMISSMKKSESYKVVDYSSAVDNANNGGLSIVAYSNPNPNGHGHLATFAVGDNINAQYKETVANIGPKDYSGFVKLNWAIGSKKEKTYFIYQPPKTTK